jgi:transposase
MAVDALGNPLRLILSAGQQHDSQQAEALMLDWDCQHAIADRGYASRFFVEWLIQRGIEPVIPPHQRAKEVREYDTWLYQERHLVECFINKIKHFRRVFSRFDKLATRYLSFLQFASSLIWLR